LPPPLWSQFRCPPPPSVTPPYFSLSQVRFSRSPFCSSSAVFFSPSRIDLCQYLTVFPLCLVFGRAFPLWDFPVFSPFRDLSDSSSASPGHLDGLRSSELVDTPSLLHFRCKHQRPFSRLFISTSSSLFRLHPFNPSSLIDEVSTLFSFPSVVLFHSFRLVPPSSILHLPVPPPKTPPPRVEIVHQRARFVPPPFFSFALPPLFSLFQSVFLIAFFPSLVGCQRESGVDSLRACRLRLPSSLTFLGLFSFSPPF